MLQISKVLVFNFRQLKLRKLSRESKPIKELWVSSSSTTKVCSILVLFPWLLARISYCRVFGPFRTRHVLIKAIDLFANFELSGIPIKSSLDNATSVLYSGLIGQLTEKARNVVREMVINFEHY